MPRGRCSKCGKHVGGWLRDSDWQCPRCRNLFCSDCSEKVGLLFKKPSCPDCHIEMRQGAKP